jgi:uncharacterized protein YjbJ (UPF0337 family)
VISVYAIFGSAGSPESQTAEITQPFWSTPRAAFPPSQCNHSSEFRILLAAKNRRKHMNKQHIKGAVDKAKGAVKEALGKATGDEKLQTEGKVDKAKGEIHKAAGDLKDATKKAVG